MRSPLAVRRSLGRGSWGAPVPFGPDGFRFFGVGGNQGHILMSRAPWDGVEWVHASMSRPGRVPSYADLVALHRAVFGGGWAYQVFAPPPEHININPHVLHLWGRDDGLPALPDFGSQGTI